MNSVVADSREKKIYRVTIIGAIVNLFLIIFKFIAGFVGNSGAMIADAVHSFSDFITDIIVIVFVKISSKPKDEDHNYGHGKYETLATAVVGICLIAAGILIFVNGVSTIMDIISGEQVVKPSGLALLAALLSIACKEIVYQYTYRVGKALNSQAVIANAWHHRSDALSSIGTALGIGGAILLGGKWTVLDPIAAIVVSFFIVKVAVKLLRPCINELTEEALPKDVDEEIVRIVEEEDGVSHPHHIMTRRIGNNIAVEMHVRVDGNMPLYLAHQKVSNIEERLKERFGLDSHFGIHIEPLKNTDNDED